MTGGARGSSADRYSAARQEGWKLDLRESLRRFQLGRYRGIPITRGRARELLREVAADEVLVRELRERWTASPPEARKRIGAQLWATGFLERRQVRGPFTFAAAEPYVLARALQPEAIVETGVAAGVSSTFWLAALERNGHGKLWSIDLPNRNPQGQVNADGRLDQAYTPESVEPGWLVPPRLRSRWELRLGPSQDLLLPTLSDARPTLFFHDSEHSYSVMTFEFSSAWNALPPGGWIYSDDISWNRAFPDFAASHSVPTWVLPTGRGLLRR